MFLFCLTPWCNCYRFLRLFQPSPQGSSINDVTESRILWLRNQTISMTTWAGGVKSYHLAWLHLWTTPNWNPRFFGCLFNLALIEFLLLMRCFCDSIFATTFIFCEKRGAPNTLSNLLLILKMMSYLSKIHLVLKKTKLFVDFSTMKF